MGKLGSCPGSQPGIRPLVQTLPWQQSLDSGLARLMQGLQQGVKADTSPLGQLPSQAVSGAAAQPLPSSGRAALEQFICSFTPPATSLHSGAGQQTRGGASRVQQWA